MGSRWWRETPVPELGPTGFVVIADGRIVHVNRRLTELLGYPYNDFIGRSFLDFLAPADQPEALRVYQRHNRGERELGVVRFRLQTIGGELLLADFDGAIFEVEGKPYECIVIHDVTEQTREKLALQNVHRRYEQIVENSEDLIAVLVEGRIEFLNRSGARILGLLSGRFAETQPFRRWVHPLHYRHWDEWLKAVESGEKSAGGVLRLLSRNDRHRDVAVTLSSMPDEDGLKVHILARDVTETRRTAAALEKKDLLLGAVVRASNDAIVVIGEDGMVRLFNPAAKKMFGLSAADVVGKPVSALIPAHLRETHERYVRDFFRTGVSRGAVGSTLELTAERSNGQRFPIELSLSAGKTGSRGFVMAVIRDVTERRVAIQALSESESRFRILYDQVGDAVYLHTIDPHGRPGRILAVNEAALRRTGFTREEFLSMTPENFQESPEGALPIDAVMERLRTDGSVIFERNELTKGKKHTPVEISARMFQIDGRDVVLSVARDITERRRINELMKQTQADLEKQIEGRTAELREAYESLEEQYRRRLAVEQELLESERMLSTMIGNLPGMAYRFPVDRYRCLSFVSDGCLELTGYDAEMLNNGGNKFEEIIHPDDRVELRRLTEESIRNNRPFRGMYRIKAADGTEKWVWEQGRLTVDAGGVPVLEGFVTDMTERKRREDRLQQLATRDFLTGLYNRRYFWEQLERHFREARRAGRRLVLGMGDLDRFKDVNDQLGHHAGDRVLEHFGALARREIRARDFAGRYGGDEFVIVFPDCDIEEAQVCVDRIREKFLGTTSELLGPEIPLPSISFGLANLEKHHRNETELVEHADKLLYQAKKAGRNRTVVSSSPLWTFE